MARSAAFLDQKMQEAAFERAVAEMELQSVLDDMGITEEDYEPQVQEQADEESSSAPTGNYSDYNKTATASAQNSPAFNQNFTTLGNDPIYDGEALFGTNFIGPGPDGKDANPFKLKDSKRPGKFLQPKDAVDAAAQRHDFAYWLIGASGVKGALFDERVAAADLVLMIEAATIMNGYMKGKRDNITNLPISYRTYVEATIVFTTFQSITLKKTYPIIQKKID